MKSEFDASGDVIVITGGANGIGRALAIAACKAGGTVVACDVDQQALAALSSEQPGILTRQLDVSDRAAVFDLSWGRSRKRCLHPYARGVIAAAYLRRVCW